MASVLISAEKLADQLANVVVFDCRFSLATSSIGPRSFEDGHIPGASHLHMETDLAGEKTGSNGRHPLPNQNEFEARLQAAGVNQDSRIVLYDDNKLAGAARAWWLITFYGHRKVQILDGGLKSWIAIDGDLETGVAARQERGNVTLSPGNLDMLVDVESMKSISANRSKIIIDSREPERFAGKQEPIDPVAGRIPGAINVPWGSVTNDQGSVEGHAAQRERWPNEKADQEPIIYCGSGVTACVNLISRKLSGLPMGKMYVGGWSEWCMQSDTAVEKDEH